MTEVWVIKSKSGNSWTYDKYLSRQVDGTLKGTLVENVTSTDENAYPTNGTKDINGITYWFVKK